MEVEKVRTKTVKRHYCDFCSKGFFKAPSAVSHESTCCKNPNRSCYLCGQKLDVKKLVEAFNTGDIPELRLAASGCPSCMLSGILQSGTDEYVDWDYAKAVTEWHREANEVFNL